MFLDQSEITVRALEYVLKSFILFAAGLVLVGCGGSSSSGDVVSDIDLLRAEVERLTNSVDPFDLTAPSYVPPGGSLQYTGIATFGSLANTGQPDGVGGEMSVDVDFMTPVVTGRIENFISEDGESREGLLTLSNGSLDRTLGGLVMIANVSGPLDILGGVKNLDGTLVGGFTGADAENITGVIETTYPDQVSGGTTNVDVNGAFVLESQ